MFWLGISDSGASLFLKGLDLRMQSHPWQHEAKSSPVGSRSHELLCLELMSTRNSVLCYVISRVPLPQLNPQTEVLGTVKLPEGFGSCIEGNYISSHGEVNLRVYRFAFLSPQVFPNSIQTLASFLMVFPEFCFLLSFSPFSWGQLSLILRDM